MIFVVYKQMFHIYVPIADVSYDIYILFGVDVTHPQPREENLAISTSSFNIKLHSYCFLEDFLFFNVPQVKQSTHMWRLWNNKPETEFIKNQHKVPHSFLYNHYLHFLVVL